MLAWQTDRNAQTEAVFITITVDGDIAPPLERTG